MRPRLTKQVREGLYGMLGIADTILEAGGEGWAMECRKGEDHGPCDKPSCEECQTRQELEAAISWLSYFLAKKKQKRGAGKP